MWESGSVGMVAVVSPIIERILARTGIPRLFTALAEDISGSDLRSLLLAVYQARTRKMKPAGLMAMAERSAMAAASSVDARLLNRFDRIAFEAAADFEAVDLAPVCPLGAEFVLGGLDQNNVLSTIRNLEVLGDPTPAMAMECARRRRDPANRVSGAVVRLCASHRVMRLQPFDQPGFTPHFRLFGLVSAGRDRGSNGFEMDQLREHIGVYLKLFRGLNQEGFRLTKPLVEISDFVLTEARLLRAGVSREEVRASVRGHLPGSGKKFLASRGLNPEPEFWYTPQLALAHEQVCAPLSQEFPEAEFRINPLRLEGLGYYTGLCIRISPEAPDGMRYAVADGGFVNWTARLLEDRKERLMTSGIGSEFVCRRYCEGG